MQEDRQKEKCYEWFLQREVNENRLLSERIALFFVANSALYTGFILLMSSQRILSCIIAFLGLAVCLMSFFSIGASIAALQFWLKAQKHIETIEAAEDEGCFVYMEKHRISSQTYARKAWEKQPIAWLWMRFHWIIIPFIVAWIVSVICLWSDPL